MSEIRYFGKHSIHFEEPDITVLTYRGRLNAEEVRALTAVGEMGPHAGRFQLSIVDAREFGGVDPAARRAAAERPVQMSRVFAAYVGASFTMRAVITMTNRASKLLRGHSRDVAFFDDFDSARAWLGEMRRKMLGG
ncbi:STAS/SEC14 domain-containing protein [Polyangium aurulentum]|uniref:STAS/SEC14 domain-containing protein n=1 Tax=Polyangium aurulentum TaxID=2567896 RepID=UPI0010ADF997|nr:STAS/SEC14 domain-containing protein [Polyangium aurulentum]UQA59724.1 STAS/SEC14 domain-containing protein [Polyangium aurulentum]